MICRTCKHFRPDVTWQSTEDRVKYGMCTFPLVRKVDFVSGKIDYELASKVRTDTNDKCGPAGAWYEKEDQRVIVWAREQWPPTFGTALMGMWFLIIMMAYYTRAES